MCNLLARCPKRLEIGDSKFESPPMCNLLAQLKGQCAITSDLLGHRKSRMGSTLLRDPQAFRSTFNALGIIVANCPETGGTVSKILDMSRSCPDFPLC